MELKNGSITLLADRDRGVTIELTDQDAFVRFVEVKMTAQQFVTAMSRMEDVPCLIECRLLDKLGKKMEHKPFEFLMPKYDNYKDREAIAKEKVIEACPEGWEPDLYFGSQTSFFTRDERNYARTIIRKWVE